MTTYGQYCRDDLIKELKFEIAYQKDVLKQAMEALLFMKSNPAVMFEFSDDLIEEIEHILNKK